MTTAQYSVLLASALHVHNLSHALHNVLTAIALDQERRGFSTIPAVALTLSCSFQNVDLHIRRNPELFEVEPGRAYPRPIRLSAEGVSLMAKVSDVVKRRAAQVAVAS